jgi:hypothetical protein
MAWCRELGGGQVDRGHFKLVLNEYRVARALDPGWQAGTDAGAGAGAANKTESDTGADGSTRTRRRREARRRQREAAADEVELAKVPAAENLERPTEAAPKDGLMHGGTKAAGGDQREQARGRSAAGGERGDAAPVGNAEHSSGSESGRKGKNKEEREEREKQDSGHVATAAGAVVAAGRAGGKVQMGAARGYGAGEGVGGGVVGERTIGVQGKSGTLLEQYVAGEVGPHGGKMELVGRSSKRWIERCVVCDGSGWQECETCENGGYWEECGERVEVRRALFNSRQKEWIERYKQSKSGLSGEVQSQAGTAPHRTGIGRQTYASAARTKTSGGANQTTAGDGRRGM